MSGTEGIGRHRQGREGGGGWQEAAQNWLKGLGDALGVGFGQGVGSSGRKRAVPGGEGLCETLRGGIWPSGRCGPAR